MPAEDFFKRYVEAGASLLGMSRERAEGIVGDFVASGEVAKEQANKAADWLVERGRTGAEELAEVVRRALRQQVSAMGLATQADMARLEARVDAAEAMVAAGSVAQTPRAKPAPKPAKVASATTVDQAAGVTADGKTAASPRKRVASPPAEGPGGAGITRSGSVRRGPSGAGGGGTPPVGDPAHPKG